MKKQTMLVAIAAVLVFAVTPSFAHAQTYAEAKAALESGSAIISKMSSENFSVARINDTFNEASQIFMAQELINRSGGKADFSLVISKANSIAGIRDSALEAKDELDALEAKVAGLEDPNSMSGAMGEIRQEFQDERYEDMKESIAKAYQGISEQQALATRLASIFDASRKNVSAFVSDNWVVILAAAAAFIAFCVLFCRRFSVYRLKKKIWSLEMEKRLLKDMIKDTQKLYFDQGKIPEDTFKVRTNKFEELIRDVDRQIPLLKAELAGKG